MKRSYCAARTLAQRARCAAAIFLRATADIIRFFGTGTTFAFPFFAFTFAHRAFCAAAILARPDADIFLRVLEPLVYVAPNAESAAEIP